MEQTVASKDNFFKSIKTYQTRLMDKNEYRFLKLWIGEVLID